MNGTGARVDSNDPVVLGRAGAARGLDHLAERLAAWVRRSRPGGTQPYLPASISVSVLKSPIASVSTSTLSSPIGGSAHVPEPPGVGLASYYRSGAWINSTRSPGRPDFAG